MKDFFKTAAARLSEPTPAFFITIQKIMAVIGAIIAFVAFATTTGFPVPEIVTQYCNWYTLLVPGLVGFIAQLTSIFRKDDGSLDILKQIHYEKEQEKVRGR